MQANNVTTILLILTIVFSYLKKTRQYSWLEGWGNDQVELRVLVYNFVVLVRYSYPTCGKFAIDLERLQLALKHGTLNCPS